MYTKPASLSVLGSLRFFRSNLLRIPTFTICAVGLMSCVPMSCTPTPMEDVSSRPEYASVIGKTFKTTQDLMAIGVTLDEHYKKQVDWIVLFPKPGFAGRGVVTTEELSKGSTIRVVRVLEWRGVLFDFLSRGHYVVEVMGKKFNAPIHIKRNGPIDDGNFGLDKAIYDRVE
jgi:hypothetical protein